VGDDDGPSVEPARMADCDELASLWVSLADGQRDHGSHLLAEPNRTRARDSIAGHVVSDGVRVVREGPTETGTVVGFVTFSAGTEGYEQDRTRGRVENLFVRPDHRDEGIGSALLAAAEAALAARGCEAVTLEVLADNAAARRFYRRAGYGDHRVEMEREL
jgi:ribosomal protein S18 acetylase RimI-like enzyme